MKEFLKEKNGQNSSARLIFVVGTIWNMTMSTYLLMWRELDPTVVLAFLCSVEAVFGGIKLAQKPMEEK